MPVFSLVLLIACKRDEACDLESDQDGDGIPECAGDCHPDDPSIFPGAPELCNLVDDDCDGLVDNDALDATDRFVDLDQDGFGDDQTQELACLDKGYVAVGGDCDDNNPTSHPEAQWYIDDDGDGYGDSRYPLTACEAPTGTVADGSDCDDNNGAVHPGSPEVCDGLDNDCSGNIDDNPVDAPLTYQDADGDGFGDPGTGVATCEPEDDTVAWGTDCDDDNAEVNPWAAEACGDAVDDDCSGRLDNGCMSAEFEDADSQIVGLVGSEFGAAVHSKGGQLLVGAPEGVDQQGAAYLFTGLDGKAVLSTVDAVAWLQGSSSYARLGAQVALGDLDGDGEEDAALSLNQLASSPGEVTVALGPMSGNLTPDFALTGGEDADLFGAQLSLGDSNSDGQPDVLVGATYAGDYLGSVNLFLGPLSGSLSVEETTAIIVPPEASYGADMGRIVADLDGDGINEIVYGDASDSFEGKTVGSVAVFSGDIEGAVTWEDATAVIQGTEAGAGFGTGLGSAGDNNGDGMADLWVGAPDSVVDASPYEGRVYVFHALVEHDTSAAWIGGDSISDQLGEVGQNMGDLDGDGFDDLALGQRYWDEPEASITSKGAAMVFYGPLMGPRPASSADWRVQGSESVGFVGRALTVVELVDGPGLVVTSAEGDGTVGVWGF